MSDGVVAELDRWLDNSNDRTTAIERRVVVRARDEIVALRGLMPTLRQVTDLVDEARAKALEEAEIACLTEARDYVISLGQDTYRDGCRNCASAIRALKDKRHD